MPLIHRHQRLIVQLSATKEHPAGRVVTLGPGWCDIDESDEELVGHPIVSQLLPRDSEAAKRLVARRDAEVARDEAISKAHADYAAAIQGLDHDEADVRSEAGAGWAERRDAALKAGERFDEPHPDPTQATATALTSRESIPMSTATVAQIDPPGGPGADQASRSVAGSKRPEDAKTIDDGQDAS